MRDPIYKAKGAAREYGEYALNIYIKASLRKEMGRDGTGNPTV